jgi:hypothetical protein
MSLGLIAISQESHKLRDFASMSAIVTALRSTAITRLPLTYGQLSKKAQKKVEGMEAFLNPLDNHSGYVATLKGSKNLACIPFLGK